jgi:hypothetical protein
MSGVSFPVTRQNGHCLVVGQPACRAAPIAIMQREGVACTEVDDPYEAMTHLCRRPLFHTALILSLHGLYREELQMIASVKRRFSHVEVWLSDTDGRHGALAEAMRLGADGLVATDGLHRIGTGIAPPEKSPNRDGVAATNQHFGAANSKSAESAPASSIASTMTSTTPAKPEMLKGSQDSVDRSSDPVLTADELRALLEEEPTPTAGAEN